MISKPNYMLQRDYTLKNYVASIVPRTSLSLAAQENNEINPLVCTPHTQAIVLWQSQTFLWLLGRITSNMAPSMKPDAGRKRTQFPRLTIDQFFFSFFTSINLKIPTPHLLTRRDNRISWRLKAITWKINIYLHALLQLLILHTWKMTKRPLVFLPRKNIVYLWKVLVLSNNISRAIRKQWQLHSRESLSFC